ncbi:MAG TPA: MBL fold metallo-hydrolase [Acidimicrobiales bacterium]|nr:MBL fold metallo-hydrolase [Acidimicrobiales bacterium]
MSLEVRRYLAGRDFAAGDPMARAMRNFAYAIVDADARESALVDAAWDPDELVDRLGDEGVAVTAAVLTHFHFDHAGGDYAGATVAGASRLAERGVPVHAQAAEVPWLVRGAGLGADELVAHDGDDELVVGSSSARLLATPGHSPGSQCVLAAGWLLTGDTLFLEGCGRTDLPGSDPAALRGSLQRLSALDGALQVGAGHDYSSVETATLDEVRASNPVLAPIDEERWLAMFGP